MGFTSAILSQPSWSIEIACSASVDSLTILKPLLFSVAFRIWTQLSPGKSLTSTFDTVAYSDNKRLTWCRRDLNPSSRNLVCVSVPKLRKFDNHQEASDVPLPADLEIIFGNFGGHDVARNGRVRAFVTGSSGCAHKVLAQNFTGKKVKRQRPHAAAPLLFPQSFSLRNARFRTYKGSCPGFKSPVRYSINNFLFR